VRHPRCVIIHTTLVLLSSAVVPKFRKHPGNNALIAAILFLETRRSHKCPNEAIKEDGGS